VIQKLAYDYVDLPPAKLNETDKPNILGKSLDPTTGYSNFDNLANPISSRTSESAHSNFKSNSFTINTPPVKTKKNLCFGNTPFGNREKKFKSKMSDGANRFQTSQKSTVWLPLQKSNARQSQKVIPSLLGINLTSKHFWTIRNVNTASKIDEKKLALRGSSASNGISREKFEETSCGTSLKRPFLLASNHDKDAIQAKGTNVRVFLSATVEKQLLQHENTASNLDKNNTTSIIPKLEISTVDSAKLLSKASEVFEEDILKTEKLNNVCQLGIPKPLNGLQPLKIIHPIILVEMDKCQPSTTNIINSQVIVVATNSQSSNGNVSLLNCTSTYRMKTKTSFDWSHSTNNMASGVKDQVSSTTDQLEEIGLNSGSLKSLAYDDISGNNVDAEYTTDEKDDVKELNEPNPCYNNFKCNARKSEKVQKAQLGPATKHTAVNHTSTSFSNGLTDLANFGKTYL